MSASSRVINSFVFVVFVAALTGCGSPPPPPPSAEKQIDDARRAMDAARNWEKQNQFDVALQEYKKARDSIAEGKAIAEGNELAQLNDMENDVRRRYTDLQTRKLTQVKAPEAPKVVAQAKTEDPEEKKKREIEAKKKVEDEKAAKEQKELKESLATANNSALKAKDKKDEEPEVAAAPKKAGDAAKADGDEKEKTEAADPNAGRAIKPPLGPFPAITEKSPPLAIVKLVKKDKYAIAYIQLYNDKDAGKRIMVSSVAFKDSNNNAVISPQQVITYQFDGFKQDKKDPSDQDIPAVTQGSHQVVGFDGFRMAAVGSSDRVKDIVKVQVKIIFGDNTDALATGPEGGVEADATIQGLKLK